VPPCGMYYAEVGRAQQTLRHLRGRRPLQGTAAGLGGLACASTANRQTAGPSRKALGLVTILARANHP